LASEAQVRSLWPRKRATGQQRNDLNISRFLSNFTVMGSQNDPGADGQRLWGRMRTNKVVKMCHFFSGQCDWISGFGTTHRFVPPKPRLSFLCDLLKRGGPNNDELNSLHIPWVLALVLPNRYTQAVGQHTTSRWVALPGRSEREMPRATAYRLTWIPERKIYELRESQHNQVLPVTPGSHAWFAWLAAVPSFTFNG
jgi:hypothetical protein